MNENTTRYASPFQIGDVTIPCRTIFAPMAGVSDLPFRLLCHEMGAGLVCMEMISAKAITYRSRRTHELWETSPEEKPVSLQIFGHEPEVMAEACRILEPQDFDILDINMGCPVPKIVNNKEGSALMKDPALIEKVVRACRENTSRPVTVKIRKGFDENHVNAVEIARIAEANGAAAIAVHGRTREQYYSGKADWDIIRQVKEAVSIPVIGNGDVTDPASAKAMFEQTGCDGIMIARGARGNPWIFRRIGTWMKTGEDPGKPGVQTVREMILRHARMLVEYKGEYTGIREMRKHVAWYTAGYPHSARLRAAVNELTDLNELEILLMQTLS